MKKPFNVDAYTARLIGRESLAKVESAIIELVKNCYDADAKVNIVYYDDIEEALYICDNGTGMSEKTVDDNWMTIGNSSKKEKYKSESGRIQSGSKGIGRFALDRIASRCEMLTINKNENILWKVNWDDFKPDTLLTEIFADIEKTKIDFSTFMKNSNNEEFKKLISEEFKDTGTVFKLMNFNDVWDKRLQNKVINSLKKISSPGLNGVFKIYFFDNEKDISKSEINPEEVKQGDYKINFNIEKNIIDISIYRNEFDFEDEFEEIMKDGNFSENDKKYFNNVPIKHCIDIGEFVGNNYDKRTIENIGDFSGTIYFNKIKSNAKDKEKFYYKDIVGRKNYSKEFGGIKIYRDNFRVRPYGDYDSINFDWLMLSQRKQQSPAAGSDLNGTWKVNSEQLTGIINISRSTNTMIKDQANRDGLVDTNEYYIFKDIILEIISLFEEDRQYVLRKLRQYNKIKNNYDNAYEHIVKKIEEYNHGLNNVIDNKTSYIPTSVDLSFEASHIETEKVKIVIEEKDNIIRDLADENSLLATLATTGIVVNMYIHELRTLNVSVFGAVINSKDRISIIRNNTIDEKILKQCDKITEYLSNAEKLKERYNSWYEVTIDNIQQNRREVKEMQIIKIFKDIISAWKKILESKEINIMLNYDETADIIFSASRQEIESIVHNLITNSISAFESKNFNEENKDIILDVEESENGFILNYSDSGCGLDEYFKKKPEKILEPFISRKIDSEGEKVGSGMGMWIIDKFVKQYNGNIDLSENKVNKNGFFIKIEFLKRRR